MKRYLAQLRPVRGTTMSDGSQCRTKLCNSRDEALMWLDQAINEEFAAGRSPGRSDIIYLCRDQYGYEFVAKKHPRKELLR